MQRDWDRTVNICICPFIGITVSLLSQSASHLFVIWSLVPVLVLDVSWMAAVFADCWSDKHPGVSSVFGNICIPALIKSVLSRKLCVECSTNSDSMNDFNVLRYRLYLNICYMSNVLAGILVRHKLEELISEKIAQKASYVQRPYIRCVDALFW